MLFIVTFFTFPSLILIKRIYGISHSMIDKGLSCKELLCLTTFILIIDCFFFQRNQPPSTNTTCFSTIYPINFPYLLLNNRIVHRSFINKLQVSLCNDYLRAYNISVSENAFFHSSSFLLLYYSYK